MLSIARLKHAGIRAIDRWNIVHSKSWISYRNQKGNLKRKGPSDTVGFEAHLEGKRENQKSI